MQATKEDYLANMGQTVKVGRYTCQVGKKRKDTKSGSWARGFKFGSSVYGYLVRQQKQWPCTQYSFDHGATWHWDMLQAMKVRKGKILLERDTPEGEFAYDSIQHINLAYYGIL